MIRGPKRELISRCYNMLLHTCMGARFSDAQCGLNAITREQARALLPLTEDTGWLTVGGQTVYDLTQPLSRTA